jgi:uncharacterized membrane protein
MSKSLVIATLSSFVVLVVVDFIWLSNAVNFLYRPKLGGLLAEKPVMWAAVLFYLIYGVGIGFFVLRPALATGSLLTALYTGAALGLLAYGTYDLTNQATIKGWSVTITIIDMAWGAFVTALASTIGLWVAQKFA